MQAVNFMFLFVIAILSLLLCCLTAIYLYRVSPALWEEFKAWRAERKKMTGDAAGKQAD